ncbi:MAG: hypothetical protein ACI90M_000606 [Candidatus Azotimanducaceae bacterium]|jgi:hypothetical protein
MTYQRARLWLGISGVGTFVLLAIAAILFDLPRTWGGASSDAAVIAAVIAIYVVLSAPFDWVGGLILPHRFGEVSGSAAAFAPRWLRGVCTHAVVMVLSLHAVLAAGQAGGLVAASVALLACMLLLLLAQSTLARWVGGLRDNGPDTGGGDLKSHDSNRHDSGRHDSGSHDSGDSDPSKAKVGRAVRIYHASDLGFTGGIVGLPGHETIIVPGHWLTHIHPEMKQSLLRRRQALAQTQTRSLGLLLAMLWNLTGFLLAAYLVPGADVVSAPGLVTLTLGAGLWNFLGLLLLPTPSRSAVLATDRQAVQGSGESATLLANAIRAIHKLQGDEPRRGRWIERVFHPIPALENRLQELHGPEQELADDGPTMTRPWHLARMTLYLSWACFGFLSRAVHCNSGRPDLWVMLPCD